MTEESFEEKWSYEFEIWKKHIGFEPIELIAQVDCSQSYETDLIHIFKNKNGSFAIVRESGCSCYDTSEADVQIYDSLELIERDLMKQDYSSDKAMLKEIRKLK